MYESIISDFEREQAAIKELQEKLIQYGINSSCPYCHSSNICSYGKNGNTQRFKCKDCGKTFSLFTGTILEKSKHSWNVWVQMTYMILNKNPIRKMVNNLHDDLGLLSLDRKSVFSWKHKIIHAMANMPKPKLKGVIQVDETFFREAQKGSRHLESTIEGIERTARKGPAPSKFGVTGNEFANIVAAVDDRGYCVAKLACLGNLTIELFYDLFDERFEDISVLCTDGNYVYRRYSDLKKVMHYIVPSNHLEIKKQNGYAFNWASAEEKKGNETILRRLYYEKQIEHINKGSYSYEAFKAIKDAYSLSLSRVNEIHNEFKEHIKQATRGVSTKYLDDYINAYVFIHNWGIKHNKEISSLKDAEAILIELLKNGSTYNIRDIENATLNMPKASDKYMRDLAKQTEEHRRLTNNKYFKYDAEDNIIDFNINNILWDLPEYKLKALCKEYKIKHKQAKHNKISDLAQRPDIMEKVMIMISSCRHYHISDEDIETINARKYAATHAS